LKINGWEIFFFQLFHEVYAQLISDVQNLRDKNPTGFKSHPKTKLLASIQKAIKQDVPNNPMDKKFLLGRTLGAKHKKWRRVKSGLPPRYRLFFRFYSEPKKIIFVWLNDEFSLRKRGDKHDVYAVFQKMVDSGEIPVSYNGLIERSEVP